MEKKRKVYKSSCPFEKDTTTEDEAKVKVTTDTPVAGNRQTPVDFVSSSE